MAQKKVFSITQRDIIKIKGLQKKLCFFLKFQKESVHAGVERVSYVAHKYIDRSFKSFQAAFF
jgi:hypothetical protein